MIYLKDKLVNIELKMTIKPVTMLSLCDFAAGFYYSTKTEPTTNMLIGLIENLLELHYSLEIREKIIKDFNLKKNNNKSNYLPILSDYLKFDLISKFVTNLKCTDLCNMFRKREVSAHLNNIDIDKLPIDSDPAINNSYPMFFKGVYKREYVEIKELVYKLTTNESISQVLLTSDFNLFSYLGNSDGLIDVKFEKYV